MKQRNFPTAEQAAVIKLALRRGMLQHKIAAKFELNQGRVSEIKSGKLYPEVEPAKELPSDFLS